MLNCKIYQHRNHIIKKNVRMKLRTYVYKHDKHIHLYEIELIHISGVMESREILPATPDGPGPRGLIIHMLSSPGKALYSTIYFFIYIYTPSPNGEKAKLSSFLACLIHT